MYLGIGFCYVFDIGSSALCTNSQLVCLHGRLPNSTFTPTLVVLSVQRFITGFESLLCGINYGSFCIISVPPLG